MYKIIDKITQINSIYLIEKKEEKEKLASMFTCTHTTLNSLYT